MSFHYPKTDPAGCWLRPLSGNHPFGLRRRGRGEHVWKYSVRGGKVDAVEAKAIEGVENGAGDPVMITVDLRDLATWPGGSGEALLEKIRAGGYAHFVWLEIDVGRGGDYGMSASAARVRHSMTPGLEGWAAFPERPLAVGDGATGFCMLAMIVKVADPRRPGKFVAAVYEFVLLDLLTLAPLINIVNAVGGWPANEDDTGIFTAPVNVTVERGLYFVHAPLLVDVSGVAFEAAF